jgi:hypothetical protein
MQPKARDVTLCHESQRGDDVAKTSAYRTNERGMAVPCDVCFIFKLTN